MFELKTINRIIKAYALVGFFVSSYTLYAELSLENDPDFKPLCDVRRYIRCSPAFVSPYAKGFGIIGYVFGKDAALNVPNGLTGMLFYVISFALSCSNNHKLVNIHYYLVMASNLSTFYLAFVLAFVIRELCLVCLATYLINAVSFLCVVSKRRRQTQHKQKEN